MEKTSTIKLDDEKALSEVKQASSPAKTSTVTMTTDNSGSPAKPFDEAVEPSEEAFDGMEESSRASADSPLTVTTNSPSEVVLTEEIVKDEEQWEKEAQKEEEEEQNRRQKLWAMMSADSREERYVRLQYLLSKSNMYTEYLIGRMEAQREDEKQKRLKSMQKKESKEKKEQKKPTKGTGSKASKNKKQEEQEQEGKSVLSTKSATATKETNIPKSPAVGDAAEKTKSRRKLPAPKPKSDVVEAVGSPVPEKENENPDVNQTEENENTENYMDTGVEEFEDFEDCLQDCLGDRMKERKGHSDPPETEPTKRGKKRKAGDESKSLIVDFFQPASKRKKPEEEEGSGNTGKETIEIGENSVKQTGKSRRRNLPPDYVHEPVIEEDGTLVKPALLTGGDLRRYQVKGLNWLKVLYENGVNGILADEMGLGKTIQCIALIAHLVYNNISGPFMVVAPLSTLPNWKAEFNRFAPRIPVVFYHGNADERFRHRLRIRKPIQISKDIQMKPVVITSYEITMRDRKYLQDHDWRYLIVDEGHRIKNFNCRLIKELRQYKNSHRLLLTGTPLQNNLSELWSLLNFLLPEIFDDLGSFETWFDVAAISEEGADEAIVETERRKNVLSMLHQILTPFMLRRVKADVDLLIPPKKELIVYAPMTADQQEFYTATVNRTILKKLEEKEEVKEEEEIEMTEAGRPKRRATKKKINYKAMMASESDINVPKNKRKDEEELESWITEMMENSTRETSSCVSKVKKQQKSQVTVTLQNIMMHLRKCCNHPYLLEYPLDPATGEYQIDEKVITKCGKMIILDKMLAELKERGHKVLIFSQMTKMLDILEDFCCVRRHSYCRLDGSYSVEERHRQMLIFNRDPSSFVFLLSTRAGGLGINLTAADTVIIYDSDWNPQCDLQAQDRCHRIGQTRPVVVYRFVTANTIDQKIVERAAAKRKLEKMVIHKGKFKEGIKNFSRDLKPLSPEELMELLKSRDHCREINQDMAAGISDKELELLLDRSDLYEEFERVIKSMKDKTQAETTVKKTKEPKKSAKKSRESQLFHVVDYEEAGSTREQSESDKKESQNETENNEPSVSDKKESQVETEKSEDKEMKASDV